MISIDFQFKASYKSNPTRTPSPPPQSSLNKLAGRLAWLAKAVAFAIVLLVFLAGAAY